MNYRPQFLALAILASIFLCLCYAFPGERTAPDVVSTVDTVTGSPSADEIAKLQQISKRAEQTGRDYYPTIVKLLGAERNYQPSKITITFTNKYDGVAGTDNDHTDVSASYALNHPDDIPGVIVHEFAHVAQHYQKDNGDVGWLVEGIADYVRWFNFEPESKRAHPKPDRAKATGSYRTTAAFLDWALKYDKQLVKELNQQLYDGTYSADSWKKLTGKSLDELNDEWVSSLKG